ncbi:hypothetical protein L596_017033 [Steinernema carpocapsae]|uniref:Uncharacterized protein n=1 Tax=Steinernema carpocapsae TaxID=34508 RepID=A0A4V6A1J6_STECR|nr:hypothetical protein L596_017027 [Steinernema carpocapsae]TKR75791.1 hypothetical protein L596_017033 [Steinernema carpocapsae]
MKLAAIANTTGSATVKALSTRKKESETGSFRLTLNTLQEAATLDENFLFDDVILYAVPFINSAFQLYS